MAPQRGQWHRGWTLIEVLVVVAIIALLLAILLPSLATAREQSRAAACGATLRQIGTAGQIYADTNGGWIVGSPNTSGNGARPGFAAAPYTGNPEHYPALQVFDWANPLLHGLGRRPPADFKQRYDAAVTGEWQCPSNRRRAGPVDVPPLNRLMPAGALAPSYATSRFFLYVGRWARTGDTEGTLWWSDDCVPGSYAPKLARIEAPALKVFLADAHVVSSTQGEIANANWGFASQGAWRSHEEAPVTYRGTFLRRELWRHLDTINLLAFDGHVERQAEGDGRAGDGQGTSARRARWWFPSETCTGLLPSRVGSEPVLTVP